MRKNFISLLAIGLAVVAITAATTYATITGQTPKQVGPFYYSQTPADTGTAVAGVTSGIGGSVKIYKTAANDTPKIGQVVVLSARNTVKASATIADGNAVAGVVCGGVLTSMKCSTAVADTMTAAGGNGGYVLVITRGRYCVLDSTGAIVPGTQVRPSGTAGRIAARTTAIDTFYRIFGKAVDTVASGKCGLVDINIK